MNERPMKPAAAQARSGPHNALDPDIRDLDLEPVAYLLARTENWSLEQIDSGEEEYRLFLQEIRNRPREAIVPSRAADAFWHAHLLATPLYLEQTQRLFGATLLHWPFAGVMSESDAALPHERLQESRCLFNERTDRVQPHPSTQSKE